MTDGIATSAQPITNSTYLRIYVIPSDFMPLLNAYLVSSQITWASDRIRASAGVL
jgi:hypothetical protein